MCSPRVFQVALVLIPYILPKVPNGFINFYPIHLGKWCPPFTYISGPKGRNCILQNKAFSFKESPLFFLFGVMGQSNWHIAKKKKSKELGKHLI
jgi:hypothetical protein